MRVSLFANARATTPHEIDCTWAEFCASVREECTEPGTVADKRGLLAIGPYRLAEGATRRADAVTTMSLVVALDVDQDLDLVALQARIKDLDLSAIVHGSPSDDLNGTRKARIYIQADREHPPSDAGRVRLAVASHLRVRLDDVTLDPSRIFFVGRLANTGPRFVWQHAGEPLDLGSLDLTSSPAPAPAPAPASTPASTPVKADPYRAAALAGMVYALGDWRDYPGRKHALVGAVGGLMHRSALWRREDCAALIRAWLPDDEPGVDVTAGVRWACRAFDRPRSDVSGVGKLISSAGEDVARAFAGAMHLPWSARHAQASPDPSESDSTPDPVESELIKIVDRTRPPPKLRYLVPGLDLAPGKVSVVQGFAYSAKTPFALQLAVCLSAGVDFVGHALTRTRTAYLDWEGGVLSQEREARICAGLGISRSEVPLVFGVPQAELDDRMVAEIERIVSVHDVGCVVIDTYTSAAPCANDFNDARIREWIQKLARIGDRTGALILILAHETKVGAAGLRAISGHGAIAGSVQTSIALRRPREEKPNLIEVSCARAARKAFETFAIEWRDAAADDAPEGMSLLAHRVPLPVDDAPGKIGPSQHQANAAVRQAGERILRRLRDRGVQNDTRRELMLVAGGNQTAAKEALARLADARLTQDAAGVIALTAKGRDASDTQIAEALGQVGNFHR